MSSPAEKREARDGRKAAKLAAATGEAPWDRCLTWLALKRRYCSMARVPGLEHCGNHRPAAAAAVAADAAPSASLGAGVTAAAAAAAGAATAPLTSLGAGATGALGGGATAAAAPAAAAAATAAVSLERIACPVDPSHTIYSRDLRAHVRVCNESKRRAETAALPCFREGANWGHQNASDEAELARFWRLAADPAPPAARKRPASELRASGDADGDADGDEAGGGTGDGGGGGDNAGDAAGFASTAGTTSQLQRLLSGGSSGGELDLGAFAGRVQAWHDAHVGVLPLADLSCATPAGAALLASARACVRGGEARALRHEVQQASLVGHMARAGLLPLPGCRGAAAAAPLAGHPPGVMREAAAAVVAVAAAPAHCPPALLVEFGAGRGLLSRTVGAFIAHHAAASGGGPASPHSYLLIDRGTSKGKADRKLEGAPHAHASMAPAADAAASAAAAAAAAAVQPGAVAAAAPAPPLPDAVVRVRLDIAHFDLARQPHAWPTGCSCREDASGGGCALRSSGSGSGSGSSEVALGAAARESSSSDGGAAAARESSGRPHSTNTTGSSSACGSGGEDATSPAALAGSVPVVGYGKHLCGVATDLALRCLTLALAPGGGGGSSNVGGSDCGGSPSSGSHSGGRSSGASAASAPHAPALRGVAIATCCHHVCSWRHYVGRAWWTGVLRATPADFELARLVTSWCIDGSSGDVRREGGDAAVPPLPSSAAARAPAAVDRPLLGRQCKRLIDAGRAWHLAAAFGLECGLPAPPRAGDDAGAQQPGAGGGGNGAAAVSGAAATVRLVHYCEPSVSPENCLLLVGASR